MTAALISNAECCVSGLAGNDKTAVSSKDVAYLLNGLLSALEHRNGTSSDHLHMPATKAPSECILAASEIDTAPAEDPNERLLSMTRYDIAGLDTEEMSSSAGSGSKDSGSLSALPCSSIDHEALSKASSSGKNYFPGCTFLVVPFT